MFYDIIVVGGGPGGYRVAQLLGKKGYTVALFEKEKLGGVCLNEGCIPFKTYLHASKVANDAYRHMKEEIISDSELELDVVKMRLKKEKVVRALQAGIFTSLKSAGVNVINGNPDYIGKKDDNYVFNIDGEDIIGSKVILATGSERIILPVVENESNNIHVISSREMLEDEELPESILVIGAGSIGLEAACFYNEAGCRVTMVDSASYVGGKIDVDIAKSLQRILEKKGISIYTNTRFVSCDDEGIHLIRQEDEEIIIKVDAIMVAVGRKPYIINGLFDALEIDYDVSGIKVDERCRTSAENIYACGDVTGKCMLAHAAYHQAEVIADNISGTDSTVKYDVIPHIIYTNPEVLSLGLTENACIEKGVEYRVATLPMTYSGKYFADYGKDGAMAKLIVDSEDRVVGIHMVANSASEISLAAEIMLAKSMNIKEIQQLIYAHPTYSEIIGELAFQLM